MLSSTSLLPSLDDEIRIDEQVTKHLPEAVQERLSDVGFLGPFALVPRSGVDEKYQWEPCFKTQVAIRATFQTCNEWEFFAENGEDLGPDSASEVEQVLAKQLRVLVEDATQQILRLKHDASTEDYDPIRQRWEQIAEVVQGFIQHSESES